MRTATVILAMMIVCVAVGCRQGELGPSPQASRLIRQSKNSDASTRQVAYKSMGIVKPRDLSHVVPILISGLSDSDRFAQYYAYHSLMFISGRHDMPQNKESWEIWYAENKATLESTRQGAAGDLKREKAEAFNQMGILDLAGGRFHAAEQKFLEAHQLQPNNASYWNNHGKAVYHQGRHRDAIDLFDQTLSINPKFGMAYMNLGDVYEERGEYEQSARYYKKAIKVDDEAARAIGRVVGGNWAAHHRLARIYLKQAVNMQHIDAIASRNRREPIKGHVDPLDENLGRALIRHVEKRRHLRDDAMVEAREQNHYLYELAIAECQLARTLQPGMPHIIVTLAMANYGAGRYYHTWKAIEEVFRKGYEWESPDFVARVLSERKAMDDKFVQPLWATQYLARHKPGSDDYDPANSPASKLPDKFRTADDYPKNSGSK